MSDQPPQTGQALLKLQIGPVQEFIAQARSTRDLWSGSYLLSWLMAAGLSKFDELNTREDDIIFPAWEEQPLRGLRKLQTVTLEKPASPHLPQRHGGTEPDLREKGVIPNLPNVLLAKVPAGGTQSIARAVEAAIRQEWNTIAEAVWKFCQDNGVALSNRERFDAQVGHFLAISWQITAEPTEVIKDWGKWTQTNAHQLAAVRQTHRFNAWSSGGWQAGKANNKDSLNGRDEAIAGGHFLRDSLPAKYKPFFKHDDWIGAITLIKRLWHVAYLIPKWGFKPEHFKMPSTLGIAAHDPFVRQTKHDEDESPEEDGLAGGEGYFAVLALDGDKMGERIHHIRLAGEHTDFSHKLGKFALHEVGPVVIQHQGRIIYAGGDDVVALLPADTALHCAEDLRREFKKATTGLDASAGIAIAHFANPLQDVVRAAREAEQRAKHQLERSAVAITLLKRSGETVEWGCRWEGGGLELFNAIADGLLREELSGKFTYALVELLQPYLTASTPLMRERAEGTPVEAVAGFNVAEVIRREFVYVLGRQRHDGPAQGAGTGDSSGHEVFREGAENSARGGRAPQGTLEALLDTYLKRLESLTPEAQLQQVIGLLRTVAFAPAQRQFTEEKSNSPALCRDAATEDLTKRA